MKNIIYIKFSFLLLRASWCTTQTLLHSKFKLFLFNFNTFCHCHLEHHHHFLFFFLQSVLTQQIMMCYIYLRSWHKFCAKCSRMHILFFLFSIVVYSMHLKNIKQCQELCPCVHVFTDMDTSYSIQRLKQILLLLGLPLQQSVPQLTG